MQAQMELEQHRAEQEKLNAQLKEREELSQAAEEKYASIQEECLAKTKKLKKLWTRCVFVLCLSLWNICMM